MPRNLLLPITLQNTALPRLLPGPMDGISEGSFISAMSSRGWVSAWWTPFLRISTGVPRMARLQNWLQPYLDSGLPVVAQIMGIHSERLAETARRLFLLGAAGVDLNCACPSPTVLANGSGGACLLDPEWISRTLLLLREKCGPRLLSCKIRAGYHSPAEIPALAAALRRGQPDLLTVHYRTVREMYQPIPDGWERLRCFRELLPGLALFGCGDIRTPQDALQMYSATRIDGLLVARGLLSNPGLLRDIALQCQGIPPVPVSEREKIAFLRDLSRPAAGYSARSPNGFVLRLAGTLFGPDSQLFARLVQLRKLGPTWDYLGEILQQPCCSDNQKQ
ncbi:MAG: tRNA-dihydrouridine synthase family protein [Oligosphaeraceae bacterium]|nr:tRNA-dihydrouridine synthase family protein [Oligosphaeraceae bacterium]